MVKLIVFRSAKTSERYAVTLEPHAYLHDESNCPGHAASDDPKVCVYCGTHIDSLRPNEEDDPR